MFSRRLQSATGGNPFFLIETLRHLHQQALLQVDAPGGWSTPFDAQAIDYAELPVPASVRDAVLARVRALGPRGEQLLQVASLLDAPLGPLLLAEVTGRDEAAVLALLEHAVAARLLAEGDGAWVFAHDLVQQTLAESQALRRRRPWHRRLAEALERHGAEPTSWRCCSCSTSSWHAEPASTTRRPAHAHTHCSTPAPCRRPRRSGCARRSQARRSTADQRPAPRLSVNPPCRPATRR